jgi:hypothetical protein
MTKVMDLQYCHLIIKWEGTNVSTIFGIKIKTRRREKEKREKETKNSITI